MSKTIQSNNPDIDTFKCKKCGTLWRAQGYFDDINDCRWTYYDKDLCPNLCVNFFGFRLKGKIQKRFIEKSKS